MLKAIIFDFDGVLCESLEIKKEAFRRLFLDYPQSLDRIVDFHMSNGGMSRFEKFQIIYRDILKAKLTPHQSKVLDRQFTEFSHQYVVRAPLVVGAGEFLKEYFRKLLFFIVSGTPQKEMRAIVQEKKLAPYFKGVYGSPRGKGELISLILSENKLKKNEVIFIGDSLADHQGALDAGVRFIGRIHNRYPNPFLHLPLKDFVRDIDELKDLLKRQSSI